MMKQYQIDALQDEIAETLQLIQDDEAQLNTLPRGGGKYERMAQWLQERIAAHRETLDRLQLALAELQQQDM